jgi:phage-related protein
MINPIAALEFEQQSKGAISGTTFFPPPSSNAPILSLPPIKWSYSNSKTIFQQTTKLGDNYSQTVINPDSVRATYEIAIPDLSTILKDEIVSTFKQYGGFTKFRWRPSDAFAYKDFVCDKSSATNQGTNLWEITATFTEQRAFGLQEKALLFENQRKDSLETQFSVLGELNFENQRKQSL